MSDDPSFDELDSSHSQATWSRVVKREQNRRAAEKAALCHCGNAKTEPCSACGVFKLCPDHNEPIIYCYGCT